MPTKKRKTDWPDTLYEYGISSIVTFLSGFLLYAAANWESAFDPHFYESGAYLGFLIAAVRAGVKPLAALVTSWLAK